MSQVADYFAWSYASQKFREAESSLARHFGPNWERMTHAISPLAILQERDFPDNDLYKRTKKLKDRATKFGPYYMNGRLYWGSIEHTMRRSKRVTFEKLAEEIILISEQIEIRRGPPPA